MISDIEFYSLMMESIKYALILGLFLSGIAVIFNERR